MTRDPDLEAAFRQLSIALGQAAEAIAHVAAAAVRAYAHLAELVLAELVLAAAAAADDLPSAEAYVARLPRQHYADHLTRPAIERSEHGDLN